jgi:hypothetical protein
MNFKVIFKNNYNEEYSLLYKIYHNDISYRWFDALKEQCSINNVIVEKDRMYNFPNDNWNEIKIIEELNNCIDIINSKEVVIEHTAYIGMPQIHLNQLHHYFEILRGGILSPAQFWQQSSNDVKQALERYNVIIHRAENFYKNGQEKFYPRIVCTFPNKKRYKLLDSDYAHFTLLRKFGEVYINYCEVGKPLYDVYKDNDDIVGEDNIRPLRYYSADFNAYFFDRSESNVGKFLNGMDQWWNENKENLKLLGFEKNDPKNAIGNIPVAFLQNYDDPNSIIQQLCNFNSIDRVEIE